ncbi:MAG: DUF393 domain-containing protein [Candidatus Omnitrophica bacterium]|nr:DUF393 domain-containing protein [Candidatus Omnitrophota bacterium]
MNPSRERPLLLYDGECGFCRRWALRWQGRVGEKVELSPYQDHLKEFPRISPEEFHASVKLIGKDGSIHSGAEAVFRMLAHAPGWGWLFWMYQKVPGVMAAAEGVYRFVARHRGTLS